MYRKNRELEPEEQARLERLYRWLYDHEPPRKLADIARALNISPGVLSATMRRPIIARGRHRALRKLGLPADVLPKPGFYVPGPGGGHMVSCEE